MDCAQRFWNKVDKSGGPDACWEWTASRLKKGYGQFGVGGKVVKAHRFVYELEHGPIPAGLCVCHRCDNPGCVRPEHLFLGTNAYNVRDRDLKGRQAKGDRHGSAKLTAAQVAEIRAAYAAGGVSYRELGRRVGVRHPQISAIVRGRYWKEADYALS